MVFRDLVFKAVVSEPVLQELKPADLELSAFTALSRKAVRNTAELFLIRPHRTLSRRFQRLLVRFDTGVNVKGGGHERHLPSNANAATCIADSLSQPSSGFHMPPSAPYLILFFSFLLLNFLSPLHPSLLIDLNLSLKGSTLS